MGADVVAAHPEVSWRPMKEMRNLVAHDYGAVDYEIVWTAMADPLPQQAAAVASILREDGTGRESE